MKTKLRKFGAWLMAAALAFAGAGAYGEITTQETFEAAVSEAASGATIELGEGEFTLSSVNCSLNFKGAGDSTIVKVGCANDGSQGHGLCAGTYDLSFENLTLRDTVSETGDGYCGFTISGDLIFRNVKFMSGFNNWGTKSPGDVIFTNCRFEQADTGRYNVQGLRCYAPKTYVFDGCTFESAGGRIINAYKEGKEGVVIDIVIKNCTFKNTGSAGKCAINLKDDFADGCEINLVFIGENKTEGEFPALDDGTKPSKLFATTGKGHATVSFKAKDEDEAVVIYEKGAKVAGAWIDPDGYKAIQAVQVEVEENSGKGITADVVQEIVANEEVAKVEQAAIVEAIKEEVEGKDAAFVKVKLEKVETEATKTTLQFDVAPYIGTEPVNNDNIKGAVPFRLPLLKEKFVEYAKISHAGDPDRFVLVKKGANGEPYVDVALTHFSTVLASVATEAEMVPDGATLVTADKNGFYVKGEEYFIVGKEGLKNFRDWVNVGNNGEGKTFQLVADVDLAGEEWTPIGLRGSDPRTPFKGTFDGCGKEIVGLNVAGSDYGLFGFLNDGAVVKGFAVRGTVVAANDAKAAVGAIVGYMSGGTVESVTNYASVAVSGTYGRIGGIVGVANDDNGVSTIKDCVNYGDVSLAETVPWPATSEVNGYAGGIIAQCSNKIRLLGCVNYGTITGVTKGTSVGGIVGEVKWNASFVVGDMQIKNCVNYGKLVANGIGNVAGIAAKWTAGTKGGTSPYPREGEVVATIANCANYGELVLGNTSPKAAELFIMAYHQTIVEVEGVFTMRANGTMTSGAEKNFNKLVATCSGVAKDAQGSDIDVATFYLSLAEAIAAAKDGDTVTLVSASSENFTLPVGVTFDASKAAYSGTISAPEGYFVKEIATKVYACQPLVAKIGDKPFSSLAEAVAAATTGDTIALFADLADVGNISLPAGVTIDGQDHQISGGSSVYVAAGGGTVQNIAFRNIHNEGNTRSAVYAESLTGTLVVQGCAFDNVDWDAIQIVPKYVGNKSESTADIKIVDNEFRHTDAESTMGAYVHIEQSADDRQDAGLKLSGLTITDNRFYKSENAVDDGMASIGTEEHINKTLVSGKFAYFGGNWFEDASSAVLPTGAIIYPARSQADVDVDDLACVLTADGVSKGYTLSEAVAKANEMTTESGVIAIDVYSQSLTVTEPVEINNPNGSFIKITCYDMIVTPAGDQVKGKLIADGCDALHFASKGSYFGKIECTEVSKNAISTTGSGEVFVYIAKSTITGEVVSKGGYQGAVEIFPENGALFDRDTYSFFDSVRRHTLVPIEQEDGTWITTKIDDSKAVSLGYKFKSKSMTVTNEADAVFGKHGLYMSHYYAKLTEVYEHSKMTFGTGSTNYKNLTLLDNLVIGEGEGKVATGTTISTDAYSISGSIVSDGSLTITDTKSTPHSINLGNVVATTLTLGATKTYKAPYAITNATVSTKLVVNACCNPLEVFGGTFKALDVKPGATVEISGGTWGSDPSAYVKTGYETVTNSGDLVTYSVYPAGIVALVGDTPYYNLADAFAAGAEAEEKTVKLYKDTDENAMIPLGVQFNTNGKTYTGKLTAPDGYAVTELSPGVYGVGVTVAMIGDDRYATLTEAFEAAQDGDTVLLSPMIIDAKAQNVLSKLAKKKVTVKGAGMDKTELLFGDGYKAVADTEACYGEFSDTDFVFENMAITIDHDNGGSSLNPKSQPEPYCQYIKNPVSQTFRNVKFNGEIVVAKKAVFDGCTFTGARLNTYKGADDEYLVWLYGGEMLITNCTFTGTGTHGPVKLNCPNAKACDVTIVDCRFEKIGTEGGIITPSCGQKDLVYDVQIDLDTVEIPENACYVGTKIAQWPAGGVAIVNGTKNKDGKYVSGAAFTEKGTDADVNACVAKVIGPDSVCLAYIGPATVLGNFRWYIGDKQLTPKTDNVEVGGLPENPSDEIKQQVAVNTNNVIKTLSSDDITKFADTDVAGSSFKADGTPKTEVKQALIAAASEQAVKDAIAAQLGESNSNERVEIKLEKFNFTVQDQSATLSVVEYDVKPWIKVTTIVDDVETVTEAVIPNLALKGHPLTFRLAVNDNFGQYAKVIHMDEGAVLETYLTEVFTGATGKYVQLKSDHFSNFFLSADVTEPKCKVGDQFYDSVQKAIEGNANVPDAVFTLTAPCNETGLQLKWGQEIDVNGQEFTGSIIPVAEPDSGFEASGYEQVKTPEGRVFSAPKQVAVPLDASDDSSKIKIRIAGKNAEDLAVAQTSGRPLWQDLAMGSTVKLIPQVLRSAIGSNVITIRGNIADEAVEAAAKQRDGVSVKYQLQKKVGAGSYVQFGEIQPTPVFTVQADELEVQTFWKIQTIFSEEY